GYEDVNLRYLGIEYPGCGTPEAEASRWILDRHPLRAHRHRISLLDANGGACTWDEDRPRPEWLPRLDGTLFTAANGYDGPGVGVGSGVYSIGTYGSWEWQDEGQAAMWRHTDGWEGWFQANAPAVERFLYLIDESDDYPQIEQWSQWIESNPGVGRALLSMATIDAPTARTRTPSLDLIASGADIGITSEWQAAVDHYLGRADKRFYAYNGWRPATGTFVTEDDGLALRALAWSQYKLKIDRWFYWESTYYGDFQSGEGQTNVFREARTFGGKDRTDSVLGETGWNYSNGDGVLFYPGTDQLFPQDSYGVAGAFASLRLKLWRRGLQDVDYLVLAAAAAPGRVGQLVAQTVPEVLWEYGVEDPDDPTWLLSDISWSTDPDDWEEIRCELAEIIDPGGPDCFAAVPEPEICTPGATNLCLSGDRFKVTVSWRDFAGNVGVGRVVPAGADDSGLFWFFASENWEMLVKVLDGCGVNDHYWVFAAATTNVEYTLTVTDTGSGAWWSSTNPLGVSSPAITDTGAFAACP
ncbi:MAG: DUF4091 domain-containing protein, partial [bacterium]|nr:DUF4091 domain-containing protein [bacterium]